MDILNDGSYYVKETGPVYYTKNMDQTIKWFKDVLGWYGDIDERDYQENGTYGCVYKIPTEIEILRIAPFTGIHLFYGEPQINMVAFMMVEGIDKLYAFVKSTGWNQITQITNESWGGRTCSITTLDGCVIRFFE